MATKKLIFKMTEGRKPISWELPLRGVMLPKFDEKINQHVDKLIHYLPGSPSIFKEDYKGDSEGKKIEFEDGVLEVNPTDVLKIEILKKHPWFNVHYELVDEDVSAQKEIESFEAKDKAASFVNESDPLKLKAIALVLIGPQANSWTEVKCKAELRRKADNEPQTIISEFGKDNYASRYIVALSLLKGIIKTDTTNTAVVWGDTNQTIIRLALGETAIDKLSDYLATNNEDAVLTMQRLGELAEGKASAETQVNTVVGNSEELAAKDLELSEKDKQIEELKKQLAAKNEPNPEAPVATAFQEASNPEVTGNEASLDNKEKNEENIEGGQNASSTAPTLEELQKEYLKLSGAKMLPPNQKNDPVWLLNKINALKAQK